MSRRFSVSAAIVLGMLLGSCSSMKDSSSGAAAGNATAKPAGVQRATAEVGPTEGNTAKGTVTFTRQSKGVRVVAELTGLPPGTHGFHIHENGDCSAADGSSAGGHFNPTGMTHGGPDAAQHHMGDLGNITADASGSAHYDRVVADFSLDGPNTLVGRAVVVHLNADDLTSQPAGNSGPRIACGVIR